MSQRKRYRKEVDSRTRMPDDGDHYALAVHPPLKRDDVYCRVYCEGRNWGGSAKALESRDEAVDYIQAKLDELEEKALDNKGRGSVPYYPEPPKPANTRYVVHPDYDGEIGAREVWGDATLASFGVSEASKYENQPWYKTREAYQKWLAPLRECPEAQVLRVYAQDLTDMAYWWAMADRDDGTLHWIRYRPDEDRLKVTTNTWTSATRTVGGIGITHAPPADLRHMVISKSPFLAGVEEHNIREYIDKKQIEPMDKADANQVDNASESGRDKQLIADGGCGQHGDGTDHWDVHCSRCGDEFPQERDKHLCEDCVKVIQREKLLEGIRCPNCDGEGYVYGTICDLQRAMNGRDRRCPECHGSGTVGWEPDLEDVHPDLRMEVRVHGE